MPPDLALPRIISARDHIDAVFLDTPLAAAASLDALLGCTLVAKDETRSPIGSFKGRGAELFAATALAPGEPLVCASAGNFGQGLAFAAAKRGHRCTVFAATTANPMKVAAMQALGAEVRRAGSDFDAAKAAARRHAAETGERFVEDGAEPAIAEGAGTIGLELAAQAPDLDAVVVPLGNGALLAGVGAALRHAAPDVEIIAVVAAAAPAMQRSLAAGRAVDSASAGTIADGIGVRVPVPEALAMLAGRYDAVTAVSEAAITEALQVAHRHLGLVLEPAGGVGLAAVLADPQRFRGRRVGTILTGRNIAPALRAALFPEIAP